MKKLRKSFGSGTDKDIIYKPGIEPLNEVSAQEICGKIPQI